MFIHRKLTTTCCVAVLALGLVACGSSDDDTSMTDPTTIEPMDSTAAEQLANAQAAVADAETMVAALDADSSHSDRAAAYAALAEAQSVLAVASEIPENEIALLRAKIARLEGDIDQAKLDAQVEADRIAAEMAKEEARIAALVAGTKEAETKRTAIGTEAGQIATDDAGLGGTGAMASTADVRAGYNLAIKHGDTSITVQGETEDDDVKFMQAADLGNGRTMHVRTMDADDDGNVITEVVIVSTDIDEPVAMAFAMVHNLTVNPETAEGDDFQSVTIVDANQAMIATDGITAVSSIVRAAMVDDDGDETVAAFETDATFDGAPGTLKCAGDNNCMVTLGADGFDFGLGWEFTPADGATVDVVDTDYLHYGFWLQKTADEDGVLTYDEVQTFAGSPVAVSGGVDMVTGSATYNGGATGVYVHSEVNSDGSRVGTTAGQFAADATLTAIFGQVPVSGTDTTGTIAPNLVNTVTGSISNFELENDEKQQWSVNLEGDIAESAGTVSGGTANGGGAKGSFSATFHGPTVEGEDMDVQPSSVVGEFDANFNNGSVAGAFGASK